MNDSRGTSFENKHTHSSHASSRRIHTTQCYFECIDGTMNQCHHVKHDHLRQVNSKVNNARPERGDAESGAGQMMNALLQKHNNVNNCKQTAHIKGISTSPGIAGSRIPNQIASKALHWKHLQKECVQPLFGSGCDTNDSHWFIRMTNSPARKGSLCNSATSVGMVIECSPLVAPVTWLDRATAF